MASKFFGHSVFVIAEAGINHNGDMRIAKKMIKQASRCGADAIKFQTVIPDELFSEYENPDIYKMAKNWILTKKDHIELKKFALKNNIVFFSTPFGRESAKLLHEINIPIFKIASGEITNHDLITFIAKMKKPVILSTGMSNIDEISSAVGILKKYNCPHVILHCVSSYPTTNSDANLSTIPFLKNLFNSPIGFSDHTVGLEASMAAVSLGASVIEKHFTLDKEMEGPDQKLSLNPTEFLQLTKSVHEIEKTLGSPKIYPVKSELKFQKNMRKSIAALVDIPKDSPIQRSMLTFLRPERGISPLMMEKIIGRKTKSFIKKGTILKWNHF
ncbi:N-acetylneuraminate synthase [Nitrosopumilus sp. b1]|uniref:N-acetylneuraminate synthase family protein n=1 Tax=Nitrosopumilus sp. b1 TaxID=2109907 RepID=UPI0015F72EA6|nr:N-acetylneuraminate synthase family protein [Nitrosopumilus sp. b1]KAF6244003.1 N-acetylneuraminate synthase [Nitrosopumilus sp. b1]